VKSKNSQPGSTRAIPEELRLNLLPWVANFKKDLDKLKNVRENSGLGSREYDKLRAEIETNWELPYLPDSVVDGAPFGIPDILPFCTPVRIKTQSIMDGKKDPRKGFYCRDCGRLFRKWVKSDEGYYCYNCGCMAKKVIQKPKGIVHHACGDRVAKVKKGELRVAGGRAKCPNCGSKKTILRETSDERIIEVKDNVLQLEIDTRFTRKRILEEVEARLSALEILGQIIPNKARRRADKYLDYWNCYRLKEKRLSLGNIAKEVYPGEWTELPELPSDQVARIVGPSHKEIKERARKYRQEGKYAERYSYLAAERDLEKERWDQIKVQDTTLQKDLLNRLRKREALRQKVWRNIQQVEQLIDSLNKESHLKV